MTKYVITSTSARNGIIYRSDTLHGAKCKATKHFKATAPQTLVIHNAGGMVLTAKYTNDKAWRNLS